MSENQSDRDGADRRMARHRKLTLEGIRRLQEKLRRRRALLAELAQYEVKRLAAEAGVSRMTISRLDAALYGFHQPDPSGPRDACAILHTRTAA